VDDATAKLVVNTLERLERVVGELNESVNKALRSIEGHDVRLQEGGRALADHGQRLRDLESRPCPAHAEQIRTLFSRVDAADGQIEGIRNRVQALETSGARTGVGIIVGAVVGSALLTGVVTYLVKVAFGG
jgi:hypothetical protein